MILVCFILQDFGQKWTKPWLSWSNVAQRKHITHAGIEKRTMKNITKELWNIPC